MNLRAEQAENKATFGEIGHFGKKGGRSVWLWGTGRVRLPVSSS